jgi:hypothetical protein
MLLAVAKHINDRTEIHSALHVSIGSKERGIVRIVSSTEKGVRLPESLFIDFPPPGLTF